MIRCWKTFGMLELQSETGTAMQIAWVDLENLTTPCSAPHKLHSL